MQILRCRLHRLTWLALVAMLGLGLLPTVSHALAWAGANGGNGSGAEVCTAGRPSRVAADGVTGGLPATGVLQHCPYCVPGSVAAGLPPSPLPDLAALRSSGQVPQGVCLAPLESTRWTAALPRAPPLRG
jgi:hypothetical protein